MHSSRVPIIGGAHLNDAAPDTHAFVIKDRELAASNALVSGGQRHGKRIGGPLPYAIGRIAKAAASVEDGRDRAPIHVWTVPDLDAAIEMGLVTADTLARRFLPEQSLRRSPTYPIEGITLEGIRVVRGALPTIIA